MKKGPTWNLSQTLPKPLEYAPVAVCLCHHEKKHLKPLSVDLKHSSRPSRVNNLLDEAYWIVCYAVALHVRKMAAGTKQVRDDKEEVCVWDRNRCFMIQESTWNEKTR